MNEENKTDSAEKSDEQDMQRIESHGLVFWARVDAVVSFILDNPAYLSIKRSGDLTKSILEHLNKNTGLNLSEGTVRRYIREAKKEIYNLSKSRNDKKLERAIMNRESLLSRVRKEKDYKTELIILKDIGELQGLYPLKSSGNKYNTEIKKLDMNRFTEHGLERLKKGDDIENVLTDPKSIIQDGK